MEQRVDALMGDSKLWGRFDPDEARRRASLLIFQIERSMDAWHYGGWKTDREALRATLVDIWAATLAPYSNRTE
jgi:hypothetical protein